MEYITLGTREQWEGREGEKACENILIINKGKDYEMTLMMRKAWNQVWIRKKEEP